MGVLTSRPTGGAPIIDERRLTVAVSDYGTQGLLLTTMDPSLYEVAKAGSCLLDKIKDKQSVEGLSQ